MVPGLSLLQEVQVPHSALWLWPESSSATGVNDLVVRTASQEKFSC